MIGNHYAMFYFIEMDRKNKEPALTQKHTMNRTDIWTEEQ